MRTVLRVDSHSSCFCSGQRKLKLLSSDKLQYELSADNYIAFSGSCTIHRPTRNEPGLPANVVSAPSHPCFCSHHRRHRHLHSSCRSFRHIVWQPLAVARFLLAVVNRNCLEHFACPCPVITIIATFRQRLKTFLFQQSFPDIIIWHY